MKKIWKAYFTFSNKERSAVIFLLSLMALFLLLPYFYSEKREIPLVNKALSDFVSKNGETSISADSSSENIESHYIPKEKKSSTEVSLFYFDPNTVTAEEWKKLGLRDKTIVTILHYRNKGGRFHTPNDIRKIWGINKEEADRIIPFAKIPQSGFPVFTKQSNQSLQGIHQVQSDKFIPAIIDINVATIEDWKNLPGIGDVLANRIVKYRERLGGFISIAQVSKTYGVIDSVFLKMLPYLQVTSSTIPKINLNQISAYDLKNRAEIPDLVAKAIVGYRQQVGRIEKVEDLKKIVFITDSIYQKLVMLVKIE